MDKKRYQRRHNLFSRRTRSVAPRRLPPPAACFAKPPPRLCRDIRRPSDASPGFRRGGGGQTKERGGTADVHLFPDGGA